MSDDPRLERMLRDALDASARASVGDERPVPPMRSGSAPVVAPRRSRWYLAAPLAAALLVVAVVAIVLGTTGGSGGNGHAVAGGGGTSPTQSVLPQAPPGAKPVHLSMQLSDNTQVGVGMPVIAYLSRPITDARAFEAATTVLVNGRAVHGSWYFERRSGLTGKPIEADFRLEHYWPAHATVSVSVRAKGLSAGPGLGFQNNLALTFRTGAAHVVTVSDKTHQMTVRDDGKVWAKFPVSLGAPQTPTMRGTKVIMEKGLSICMRGPGYDECGVKDTQRLTLSGEYLHSAPWNVFNIEHGIDSSNGCTNLAPKDAAKLYKFLEIGDVVRYPDASGSAMTMAEGYGDWDVSWSAWKTGGLYRTS